MRMVIIEDGKVSNVIEADSVDAIEGMLLIPNEYANIGDNYDSVTGKFTSPVIDNGAIYIKEKSRYLDQVRSLRSQVLARLNGHGTMMGFQNSTLEEKENCLSLIKGLLDITTIQEVDSANNMDELANSIKAEYSRIVGLALPNLSKAFRNIEL